MMDLISIIVPVYNTEKYLGCCIESILRQTYRNLEIIFVNDGSEDKSAEVIASYAEKDERIVLLEQEHGGAACARNKGIRIARGAYLSFVDSDDVIADNMIQLLYERLIQCHAQIAVCGYELIDEKDREIPPSRKFPDIDVISENQIWELYYKDFSIYFVSLCNKLYQRKIFEKIELINGKHYEDEFFFDEIMQDLPVVTCMPEKMYFYRQWPDSLMGQNNVYYCIDLMETFLIRLDYLYKRRMFDTANHAYAQVIDSWLVCYDCKELAENAKFQKCMKVIEKKVKQIGWQYHKEHIAFAFRLKIYAFSVSKRLYVFLRDVYRRRQKACVN